MSPQVRHAVPAGPPPEADPDQPLIRVLIDGLAYAADHDYWGTDYGSGLARSLRQRFPRLAAAIPMVGTTRPDDAARSATTGITTERHRDYEGTARFVRANVTCQELLTDIRFGGGGDTERRYGAEARRLADWLTANRCEGYHGFCGGPVDDWSSSGVTRVPDVSSTAAAVTALLAVDGEASTELVETVTEFLSRDLSYRTVPGGALVDPSPGTAASRSRPPIAALASAARIYVSLYEATGRKRYRERATALLDTVTGAQTPSGGWVCAARGLPYSESVAVGMTLEGLARYGQACAPEHYESELRAGIDNYRSAFFTSAGTTRSKGDHHYPRELVTYAQGIVTFTLAGELPFSERVLRSALADLYVGEGRFYAWTGRYRPWRVTPVSSVHGPMVDALATYLDAARDDWHPQSVVW